MPTVPTIDAPTVTQSGAPLGISPPPDAFGANVAGDSLKQLGATAGQMSDVLSRHAEQFQAINNKASSDQAALAGATAQSQWEEDFKTNNRAMIAQDPSGAVKLADQKLGEIRDKAGESLNNPMAKAMYDVDSRRNVFNAVSRIATYASDANRKWVVETQQGVQKLALDEMAASGDLSPQSSAWTKYVGAKATIDAKLGTPPELATAELKDEYGKAVANVALTKADNGDAVGAHAIVEQYKAGMSATLYQQTLARLRPALQANQAATVGDTAVSSALHGFGTPGGPTTDFVNAVDAGEGRGKNPLSSAEGIGQFTKGTWLGVVKGDPQFAHDIAGKTDAQILALRDDSGVASRAIIAYRDQNASALSASGVPVNPQTLGLAHRFGAGDAQRLLAADQNAPASSVLSAKVLAANPSLAKLTVGQAVGGAVQHFNAQSVDSANGGPPTSADLQGRMLTVLATADHLAEQQYPGNAVFKDQAEARAIATLNKQITAAKDTENNNYSQMADFVQQNNVNDKGALFAAMPGAASLYNSLPQTARTALDADMRRNGSEFTYARQTALTSATGMAAAAKAGNASDFLKQDFTDTARWDLRTNDRIALIKEQQTIANKPAATDPGAKVLNAVTSSKEWKASMLDAGIKPNTDGYYHALGSMSYELDQWNAAHPNVPPGPKDVQGMQARVFANRPYTESFLGIPIGGTHTDAGFGRQYAVTAEEKTWATAQLAKAGYPSNAENIGKLVYGRRQQLGAQHGGQ